MKKTHLKLQSSGEVEDTKLVEKAKSSSESRKMMKQFKNSHSSMNKGEDARSNNKLVEMKKKKLMQKMKASKKGNQREKYGEK